MKPLPEAGAAVTYEISVNGKTARIEAPPGTSLLWVIRHLLELRGSKEACGRGECGACTVLHGDDPVPSCLLMIDLVTLPITTIEGLAEVTVDLRQRWTDLGGFQCGFCTPGFIVRASALGDGETADENAIRRAVSGNICRCTGYVGLVKAIQSAHGSGLAKSRRQT
jgi:aerobic-type carbon monoxide dehydrogenase small subunit (CoxS/CutS family)